MGKKNKGMAKNRSQLNINIDPNLLLKLKSEAMKNGQTLTAYITDKLNEVSIEAPGESLEQRLTEIEKLVGIDTISSPQEKTIGTIFTNEGAKAYGEMAKTLFDSHARRKGLTRDSALKELALYLKNYEHSNPELVFQILLGNHDLTGIEMTGAYRKGSCAMRSALVDWCNDPLEELNEAFLNAVITNSLV